MLRKFSLLTLLLPVFILSFIFSSPIEVNAADTVYARNGEVYVMIGEGARLGVYASQKLDGNGNRITVRPDGVKLFGDPTKMSNYQALAVDQFRNIYVLAAKMDPGLINLPAGQHFWVDPPKEEGICGVGNDGANDYHDILNHCDSIPGQPHGGNGKSDRAPEKYSGHAGWSYLTTPGGSAHNTGNKIAPVDPPAAQKAVYDAKYAKGAGRSLKRIPLNYWYCGFLNWTAGSGASISCSASTVTWQVKYNVKIQRVNLWISHFVDAAFVPAGALPGLPTDPAITPNVVNDMFEAVFDTVNMQYTYARATMCGESFHPGGSNPVAGNINTDYKIGFTTTGAGRRYVYSSLPTPKIKKGTIRLTAGNTFGIPQMDSADFTALNGTQVLNSNTLSMGAATKDPTVDYVYTCPQSDPSGWDIIGFAVADQWDGTGGVRYMLLQAPGAPARKFDENKAKKLRWNKMEGGGYVPSTAAGVKSGLIDLNKDVKVVAGDGSGSVYYLTSPRAVFDVAAGGDTLWSDNSSVSNLIPLATPGKPDGPRATTNGNVWQWKRKFTARAATELFQIDYYTKTETKLNDFTVGQEEALMLETFADANGQNLMYRQAVPDVIPPKVADIKLALATINLAGPPVGNNEKMCVDIVSSNVSTVNLGNMKSKDITSTNRDAGPLAEAKMEGDSIAEDTQYRCYMENAPPVFSQDLIKKNTISGLVLKDENGNGTIGGFDYALRPATACYYWRVEMVEPMKKTITPDTGFASTRTTPATNVTLTKVTVAPASWGALAGKGARSTNVNLADGSWYSSRGSNADKLPNQENAAAAEAPPDFAFTPKEPGVYKVSMVASAKKWNYGVLGYPSYITDRETIAGCKDGTTHYLFFDNGEGGGIAKNGVKDGGEDYIAERYIVVTAKQPVPDKYITGIQFENPTTTINENHIGTWTVKANLRYVKSFNHEVGTPSAKILMETYNGIGAWDYPDTAVADWGLPPFDGIGENYVTGAPAGPSNGVKTGATSVMNTKLRNFGEKAPGSNPFSATTPELPGVPPNIIFGTPPSFPSWVVGAGTSANPAMQLSKADRGCVEYEWRLAAEEIKDDGSKVYHTTKLDAASATKPIPDFLLAKGRLSDERPSGQAGVLWSNYANNDRRFDVRVTLRYAFDVPLDPGKYYLYIKFKYPKLKWEGRSPKKDKDGALVKDAQNNQIYAYHDLVSDGVGESYYTVDNWSVVDSTPSPAGLAITVKDLQAPQAFFSSDTFPAADTPKEDTKLPNATVPLCGVEYKGGTTGDAFKGTIKFNVCDNNPNKPFSAAALRAMVGARKKALAWADFNTITKTEEKYHEFNIGRLKMALEKTIHPPVGLKAPGVVQDVTTEVTIIDTATIVTSGTNKGINTYFGYGVDAPFRRAKYQMNNPANSFTAAKVPYDMTGSLPMHATGADGSGNKMSDFDRNGQYNELEARVNAGATTAVSEKKFPGAPAFITIVDNDAPSIRFYALRSRDNVYREYIVTTAGTLDATDSNKPLDHASNHDDMDWDPTAANKLKFTTWGETEVNVKDCNLDGSVATLANQNNPVHPKASMPNNTGKCTQLRPTSNIADLGVATIGTKSCYVIKYGGKSVGIAETYNSFAPTNLAYYEFDKILPANAGDMLELIEDARNKFEIAAVDNIDNTISVVQPVPTNNGAMMAGNCYVDTLNLGDPIMLGEVMGNWKTKGSLVETYGIFRDPSPTGANAPSMFIVIKDNSGNATAVKIPLVILHTLFRPNVINVETRRSE